MRWTRRHPPPGGGEPVRAVMQQEATGHVSLDIMGRGSGMTAALTRGDAPRRPRGTPGAELRAG